MRATTHSRPRLLGQPHGVVMTLDTVAFVPIAAALVVAVRLVLERRAARAAGGRWLRPVE
jgi:hypothetical protein